MPGPAISAAWIGTMTSRLTRSGSECTSRSTVSVTEPCRLFSIGTIASSAAPRSTNSVTPVIDSPATSVAPGA